MTKPWPRASVSSVAETAGALSTTGRPIVDGALRTVDVRRRDAVGPRARHFGRHVDVQRGGRRRGSAVGEYIDTLGHPTWMHDDGGDLPPVLLLHGGLSNSDAWQHLSGALRDRHRVVMFDRRGHGRTADTAEEFDHASMADEAAAVIETLGLAPVDVVGYSDGGAVVLHLARNRPELLRAVVLLAVNYHGHLHARAPTGGGLARAPAGSLPYAAVARYTRNLSRRSGSPPW